jgi:hypothetical protein
MLRRVGAGARTPADKCGLSSGSRADAQPTPINHAPPGSGGVIYTDGTILTMDESQPTAERCAAGGRYWMW